MHFVVEVPTALSATIALDGVLALTGTLVAYPHQRHGSNVGIAYRAVASAEIPWQREARGGFDIPLSVALLACSSDG
jgi:hypothetical protein